jgi:glycosyltransferase involved in cell wall biosynthesis
MLEAMQEGIPILASDIPPHQQLINQERGILFETGNLASCINSLDWAIHHPRQLAAMAQNSQNYVQKNYNWERITTENLKLYSSVLKLPEPVGINDRSDSRTIGSTSPK